MYYDGITKDGEHALHMELHIPGHKWHKDVEEFHNAFNHPINYPEKNHLLNRCHWIHEEIIEFATHDKLVDEVDALIDLLYFTVGYGVELGLPSLDEDEFVRAFVFFFGNKAVVEAVPDKWKLEPKDKNDYIKTFLASINSIARDTVYAEETAGADGRKVIADGSRKQLRRSVQRLGREALYWFAEHGTDPQPFWDIVQKANMAKLWPDGKPHYRKDGKVVKPEGWVAPEPQIAQILEEMFI